MKISLLHCLGLIFICLTIQSPLFAQTSNINTQIVYDDEDGHDGYMNIDLDGSCDKDFTFTFQLTNLDVLNLDLNVEDRDLPLPLPADYPPIFIQYNVAGVSGEVAVTEFTFLRESNTVHGPVSVYEGKRVVKISFRDFCQGISPNGTPHDGGASLSTSLVTSDGEGGYSPYPACEHWGQTDIFSCSYFGGWPTLSNLNRNASASTSTDVDQMNIGDGDPDRCSIAFCEAWLRIAGGVSLRVQCHEGCFLDNEVGLGLRQSNPSILANTSLAPSIELSPNPFTSDLMVRWNKTHQPQNITLFDVSGKAINSWVPANSNKLQLNTRQIAPGLYFLHIDVNGQKEVHKVIKH